jgi:hypothetical protein
MLLNLSACQQENQKHFARLLLSVHAVQLGIHDVIIGAVQAKI